MAKLVKVSKTFAVNTEQGAILGVKMRDDLSVVIAFVGGAGEKSDFSFDDTVKLINGESLIK